MAAARTRAVGQQPPLSTEEENAALRGRGGRCLGAAYRQRIAGLPMTILRLEAIGDDLLQHVRMLRRHRDRCRPMTLRDVARAAALRGGAQVQRVIGVEASGRLCLRRTPPQKSYADANRTGSRGVEACFVLERGPIYKVTAPETWRSVDTYFLRYGIETATRLSLEEVVRCLES